MLNVIWTMIFLTVCTVTDVKERKINILFCVINQISMTIIHIFNRDFSVFNIVSGIGLGAVFFLINKISKQGIGMGDVCMIITIGIVCGVAYTVEILFWSFGSCLIFSVVGIILKKMSLKSCLPMAPFMLVGAIVTGLFSMDIFV